MSTVIKPEAPATSDYPTEAFTGELEEAHKLFKEELASTEGWEDQGEREGVQLYRKPDPNNAYAVPTTKGETIVEGCTSDEFLAVILLEGMRKRWDPRFQSGHVLKRFNRLTFQFHSCMKGMGWLVYARDICGVQKNYRDTELNKEILVVQTSVVDLDSAPEQYATTRAHVTLSGWQLLPQGNDLKVTYIVKIDLAGSMPASMVSMIATETPLCTGRARDVYHELGFAPFVHPTAAQPEPTCTFQTETFAEAPGLEYRCYFTTKSGAEFDVIVDGKKMYKDGFTASIEGSGAKVVADEAAGKCHVTCDGDGNLVTLVIDAK